LYLRGAAADAETGGEHGLVGLLYGG